MKTQKEEGMKCATSPTKGVELSTEEEGLTLRSYTLRVVQDPDGKTRHEQVAGKYRLRIETAYVPRFLERLTELLRQSAETNLDTPQERGA